MKCINKNLEPIKELLNDFKEPVLSKILDSFPDDYIPTKEEALAKYSELLGSSVDYKLKVINALQSDKVRQPNKNFQGFLNDLQKQGVPKEQLQLLQQEYKEGDNKEDLISTMLANYSYTIEINTSKDKSPIQKGGYWDRNENYIQGYDELVKDFDDRSIDDESRNFWFTDNFNHYFNRDGEKYFKDGKEIRKSLWLAEKKSIDRHLKAEIEYLQKPTPSQIYSNLTVPGGTAYIESEIAIPDVFFTSGEIEGLINAKIEELKKSGDLEIKC